MNPHVVIQPCGGPAARAHFSDTVQNRVPLAKVRRHLPDGLARKLDGQFPGGAVPLWGVAPGTGGGIVTTYNRAQVGDVVLFTGEKRVFASGAIAHKFHSPKAARDLWGSNEQGQTWEYMYALDEITARSITYDDLNGVSGDSANNNHMRLRVMPEEMSARVLAHFDLFSEQHSPLDATSYPTFVKDFDGQVEVTAEVHIRCEQAYLRKILLPAQSGECALCGRTFPVQFLVAAHVKRRSQCTIEEKLDIPRVVFPACRFGCDELYERGYITVDPVGDVVVCNKDATDGSVGGYVSEHLLGRNIGPVLEGREHYFAWHRERWCAAP